jgi:hypothetical protein
MAATLFVTKEWIIIFKYDGNPVECLLKWIRAYICLSEHMKQLNDR